MTDSLPILSVNDLAIGYSDPLSSGITFEVSPGQLVLLTGPNGSGKSTLAQTLFGLLEPKAGNVRWPALGLSNPTPSELLGVGVRFLGQGPRGFARMSVGEQHHLIERLYGVASENPPRLRVGSKIDSLSFGQRRLAAFDALSASRARLLILDEPFMGLDVATSKDVTERILEHLRGGTAIILIDHRPNSSLLQEANATIVIKASIEFAA